jgi:hypothetical protein
VTAAPVDTDSLPPTQYLVLEVLAARHRTGETTWSFPTSVERALLALQSAGLVDTFGSTRPKTVRVRLTEAGKTAVLSDTYHPPTDRDAAADALKWAAARIDPGPRDNAAAAVEDMATTATYRADRGTATRLRMWADQITRGAIDIWKEYR